MFYYSHLNKYKPKMDNKALHVSWPASFATWHVYSPSSSCVALKISSRQDFSVVIMLHLSDWLISLRFFLHVTTMVGEPTYVHSKVIALPDSTLVSFSFFTNVAGAIKVLQRKNNLHEYELYYIMVENMN